jgi:hypothetical protein
MSVISASWEAETGGLQFEASLGKKKERKKERTEEGKSVRSYFKKNPGMVVHACNPIFGDGGRRIIV